MTEDIFEGEHGDEPPPRERLRPAPPRTQPIRHPGGVFGNAKGPAADGAQTEQTAFPRDPDFVNESTSAAAEGASAAEGFPNAVLRAVAAGYRVVDEQLRQGRHAARDFWSPATDEASGAATASGEPNDTHAPDIARLGERWLRNVGDLGVSWLELMQAVSRAGPERCTEVVDEQTAGPFAAGRAASRNSGSDASSGSSANSANSASSNGSANRSRSRESVSAKLSVAIAAARPVELRIDLHRLPAEGELQVSPLVDSSGELPAIRGVTLRVVEPHTPEQGLRLEASVDAAQPCGIYHGVVLSAGRSQPIGTLSLHIT